MSSWISVTCHYNIWARARSSWIQTLLSSSCDSSGSHDQSCFSSQSSSDHQMFSVCSFETGDVFRAFSGLFYPSAQWCLVMWFGSLTLLLMTESVLFGSQCIEVFDGSSVGSVFPVCSRSNGSQNHWCEGPPFLFPFSLHLLLPVFNQICSVFFNLLYVHVFQIYQYLNAVVGVSGCFHFESQFNKCLLLLFLQCGVFLLFCLLMAYEK